MAKSSVVKPGNIAIVRVTTEHLEEITLFCQSLREISERDELDGFVINLAGIRLAPSELLSAFVNLNRRSPGTVKLCHVHPNIVEALTRTQLMRLFEVFDDEGVALERLRQVPA